MDEEGGLPGATPETLAPWHWGWGDLGGSAPAAEVGLQETAVRTDPQEEGKL